MGGNFHPIRLTPDELAEVTETPMTFASFIYEAMNRMGAGNVDGLDDPIDHIRGAMMMSLLPLVAPETPVTKLLELARAHVRYCGVHRVISIDAKALYAEVFPTRAAAWVLSSIFEQAAAGSA